MASIEQQPPHPASKTDAGTRRRKPRLPAILAYGFRPFFLLAAAHAALAIPLWTWVLHGLDWPAAYLTAYSWHAHEMLFGFVAAAIAGFLLTAVPSWTGRRGYAGLPLALLVMLWLAGRAAMTLPLGLPAPLAAAIDLAFFPALALTVLPALLRSGNRRNLVFIVLLALLFASNLHFHLEQALAAAPLRLGLNTMLFMLALLGGRVVPAFTSAALKQRGLESRIRRFQPLDRAVLLVLVALIVTDVILPDGIAAALIAAIASLLLAAQLAQWQGHRCAGEPILWILHVAYAWLPLCLGLKAAWLFGWQIPATAWLHALGAGAMTTMIMAIMSRAALGHTGRVLKTPRLMVYGYYLVCAAAICRVFVPLLPQGGGSPWLVATALLWSLAFIVFLLVYAPILCTPRIDGKPG